MVEYLGSLTSREQDLLASFGASGCILDTSWQAALQAELEGTTKLTSLDMRFLLSNKGKCTKTLTTRTGFIINAGNLFANVYDETTYKGKTDATIEIEPGLYLFTVKKTLYDDQEVPIQVEAGNITQATITLVKSTPSDGTEIPTGEIGTAKIEWTGKREFPSPIQLGKQNWFKIELKNSGTKSWVGYIGVRLTGSDGTAWTYDGDSKYATVIKASETKYVSCATIVPDTIGAGNISVTVLKYTVSG